MKPWRTRYRWWLILACVALLVVIGWWQLSGHRGRFTRQQYDRIRIGMTPAEVALAVGCPPNVLPGINAFTPRMDAWDTVAAEPIEQQLDEEDGLEEWLDGSVVIIVSYGDGKTIRKQMDIRVPPWKAKAREWLDKFRGLVGGRSEIDQ